MSGSCHGCGSRLFFGVPVGSSRVVRCCEVGAAAAGLCGNDDERQVVCSVVFHGAILLLRSSTSESELHCPVPVAD